MNSLERCLTVLDEYLVGRRRLLEDGSIVLRGTRWGMLLILLAPPLLIASTLSKGILQLPQDSPALGIFQLALSVLLVVSVGVFVFAPRRIIRFDSLLGGILIRHAGLFRDKDIVMVGADEITDIRVERGSGCSPSRRPCLVLETLSRKLHLASLGQWLASQNLVGELRALVESWKQGKSRT